MIKTEIDVRPISGALGAEIHGVDLSEALDDATFAQVRNALHEHLVIFFREQHLVPETQIAFARRFGTLNVHPYVKGLDEYPEVMPIIKEPADKANFGGGWHSDMSFLEEPVLGTVLYALETPTFGGDTLFANQYLAYEQLTAGMKELIGPLRAVHSASSQYGPKGESSKNNSKRSAMRVAVTNDAETATVHPIVRTHPETGRKGLYVNAAFTEKIEGLSRRESRPILEYLFQQATREEFTCRFRWEAGSVAFWDNRCTQHFALNDYSGQRREMHRVTVNGDRPV